MNYSTDRRRILLVDRDGKKRQLRTIALRNYEIEVHTVNTIDSVSFLGMQQSYDLVLLAAEENPDEALLLCHEMKAKNPRQRMALLVGAPQYVREIAPARKPTPPKSATPEPTPIMDLTGSQPAQWNAMMQRLLVS